jgi:methyl-accepting chemotaxis protein
MTGALAETERLSDHETAHLRQMEACVVDVLPVFPLVCRQLTESTEQVERSVVKVCSEFQAISEKAQQSVTRATQELNSGSKGHGVRQLTSETAETIERLLTQAEDAHGRLIGIASRVDGLEQQMLRIQEVVEQVDRLSAGLKILSLNARIEAARAGRAGAAFGIVANETGNVAKEAAGLNKAIQEAIGKLSGDVRLIAGQIRDRVTDGRKEVESARSEVGGTLRLLTEASDDLRRSVEETARDAKEVAGMIGRAIVALQFQDTVSQRVGHAVDALREVESDLAGSLDGGTPPPISTERERRLAEKFTMDAERAVLGGGVAPVSNIVELF